MLELVWDAGGPPRRSPRRWGRRGRPPPSTSRCCGRPVRVRADGSALYRVDTERVAEVRAALERFWGRGSAGCRRPSRPAGSGDRPAGSSDRRGGGRGRGHLRGRGPGVATGGVPLVRATRAAGALDRHRRPAGAAARRAVPLRDRPGWWCSDAATWRSSRAGGWSSPGDGTAAPSRSRPAPPRRWICWSTPKGPWSAWSTATWPPRCAGCTPRAGRGSCPAWPRSWPGATRRGPGPRPAATPANLSARSLPCPST